MYKMFYLYSKENLCEALYICENNDDFENPILKTNVYPIGTLLCNVLKILDSYNKEKSLYTLLNRKSLSKGFESIKEDGVSFVCQVNNDPFVLPALELLLTEECRKLSPHREYQKLISLLKDYLEYIEICLNKKSYANLEWLEFLSKKLDNALTRSYVYYSEQINKEEFYKKENEPVKNIFTFFTPTQDDFNPNIKKKSKPLFKLDKDDEEYQSLNTSLLKTPFYVYEIHDVVDFIVSSLQTLFSQNYVLSKCTECNNWFATHNHSRKYCPSIKKATCSEESNTSYETNDMAVIVNSNNENSREKKKPTCCADIARLKSQTLLDNSSECNKIHKRIRTMLAARIGRVGNELENEIRQTELDIFKKQTATIRSEDTMSETDYIKFMQDYWKNIKAVSKERKQYYK